MQPMIFSESFPMPISSDDWVLSDVPPISRGHWVLSDAQLISFSLSFQGPLFCDNADTENHASDIKHSGMAEPSICYPHQELDPQC